MEDKLLAPRATGEPTFVRVLIDYVDSALAATGALGTAPRRGRHSGSGRLADRARNARITSTTGR